MPAGKFAAIGISMILVVGVVIGVIVGVSKNGSSKEDDPLATTSKSVSSICGATDYKQACVNSLASVSNNASASPKDYIQAAIKFTEDVVKQAKDQSSTMKKSAADPMQKMALEDCEELMDYAIDELQASFSSVGDSDLHTISDREAELKNWLSAVISYQQTCMDGVTKDDLHTEISNGMLNATQLTSNALAIVSSMSDIMKAFNITINMTSVSDAANRMLYESDPNGVKDAEYPSWFSNTDRKLLASKNNAGLTPNAVVAKDGSGQYKTINDAINAVPKNNAKRFVIYVKAGIYNEIVLIDKTKTNIFMYGDGPRKTLVTGNRSNRGGYPTFETATFSAIGTGFVCKSMGFQNTAGAEGHQAVALRVQSDMSSFYNCRMDGYQDTLYVQTHRQFYRNCVISGTVDFIFGDSSTVIQNSLIIIRKPMDNQQNTVTAHGRADKFEATGLVIQNCRIVPEEKLFPQRTTVLSYLGRPWKQFSRTIIMESTIGDVIQPVGWMPWQGNFALDTLYYAEYANRGPGAVTARRVNWKGYKVITNRNEAMQFTAGPFLQGNTWLPGTGAPFFLGMKV